MGSTNITLQEEKVKGIQRIIANLQAELKNPNTTKYRKEGIRKDLARLKEDLSRAKESLRQMKAQAKK